MNKQPPYQGPRPGQKAYDTVAGRVGVLQAICDVKELLFDHRMPGPLVAFLRPEKGGREWTTDMRNVKFPEEASPHPDSGDELTPTSQ